jgi:hypothetical protein
VMPVVLDGLARRHWGNDVGTSPEQTLTRLIGEAIAPLGFREADPLPLFEDIRVADWRRRTPNSNRGVAHVALRDGDDQAAGFARAIRKPLGRALGYLLPFLNEIGLQVVLSRRGILGRAGDLRRAVDTTNPQTVVLQSLHLVDLAALDPDPDLPEVGERSEELSDLPQWARVQARRDRAPLRASDNDPLIRQIRWAEATNRPGSKCSWTSRMRGPPGSSESRLVIA